ncbi:hypothetical protein Bcav_0408 [Beutenbergia cavernae DSM 12333]|uniref:Uncharacterized protein n=1 Tax=Beutenbergia cavernae (strain ATCC BAA-8 / DSM 12333 / CCUG 43141 / JCM 11478 / NBRC 16432 / NCIMB 13614 / HKI 0122) TaxID=471853 RepID=C5BWZ7_BEUC1|nr:hypothetical protein [Beutenbergia cavernae]ACQ78672.1 hypothetical protein Bcav_0408 [Beutenbergia cavernae DSM 12333]
MTYEVAMEALAEEAVLWYEVANGLRSAANSVNGLGVVERAFTFLGDGFDQQYEQVRTRIHDLLVDGANTVQGASEELRYVHATYASTDEAAKARLDGQWNWE